LAVLTHAPPQLTSGDEHPAAQMPTLHTWPGAQIVPQLPQFDGSVFVSTQTPLHTVAVPLQLHAPPLQA
jgi:hypothetical protein